MKNAYETLKRLNSKDLYTYYIKCKKAMNKEILCTVYEVFLENGVLPSEEQILRVYCDFHQQEYSTPFVIIKCTKVTNKI